MERTVHVCTVTAPLTDHPLYVRYAEGGRRHFESQSVILLYYDGLSEPMGVEV